MLKIIAIKLNNISWYHEALSFFSRLSCAFDSRRDFNRIDGQLLSTFLLIKFNWQERLKREFFSDLEHMAYICYEELAGGKPVLVVMAEFVSPHRAFSVLSGVSWTCASPHLFVTSAMQFEGGGMDAADVEPLLFHFLVRQQAVARQREPAAAFAAARHSPKARPLEQEDGAVGVGEVGSVDVAIWMVSARHGGENLSEVFGEASRQAVCFGVERVHLLEQTFQSLPSQQ